MRQKCKILYNPQFGKYVIYIRFDGEWLVVRYSSTQIPVKCNTRQEAKEIVKVLKSGGSL